MKIRKQVSELTRSDLLERPVWEFALDEKGKDSPDGAAVRPWEGEVPVDPANGRFIVRAVFTLADGTQHLGYLTPPGRGDRSIVSSSRRHGGRFGMSGTPSRRSATRPGR